MLGLWARVLGEGRGRVFTHKGPLTSRDTQAGHGGGRAGPTSMQPQGFSAVGGMFKRIIRTEPPSLAPS